MRRLDHVSACVSPGFNGAKNTMPGFVVVPVSFSKAFGDTVCGARGVFLIERRPIGEEGAALIDGIGVAPNKSATGKPVYDAAIDLIVKAIGVPTLVTEPQDLIGKAGASPSQIRDLFDPAILMIRSDLLFVAIEGEGWPNVRLRRMDLFFEITGFGERCMSAQASSSQMSEAVVEGMVQRRPLIGGSG